MSPWLPYPALVVAAFVGGVLGLPTFTIMRQSMSVLVPADRRRTAFAMDSIGVEISFVLGPTLGVLLATQVSTRAAVLAVGAALVAAGIGLMVINPPTRTPGLEHRHEQPALAPTGSRLSRLVPPWFSPALGGVLAATLAATIVLSGSEVSMVAVLREHDAVDLTGVVMAVWSVASLAGGLVYGAVHRALSPNVLLLWLSLLCIPVGLAGGPWWLALLIIPTGALCAPVMSATGEAVAALVPERVRGEAMGWHGSALTVGVALGSPLAGSMIDLVGPVGGFAAAGSAGVVLALVGLVLHRRRPAEVEAASAVPRPDDVLVQAGEGAHVGG
ncbi:MAG: MFS transporter [Kineosporiaceae bacterium]